MGQGFEGELDALLKDILSLHKPDGRVFENVRARISPEAIFITDVRLPIEIGDSLIRALPNGLQEEFIVDEPRYEAGIEEIPPLFRVTVHRAELKQPRSGPEQTSSAGLPRTEQLGSWQQISTKFERGAVEHSDLLAGWDSRQEQWTLLNGPDRESPNPGAALLFKDAARAAVALLGRVPAGGPSWCIWLDVMRKEKRGFRRIPQAQSFGQVRALLEMGTLPPGARLGQDGEIPHIFEHSVEFCQDLGSGIKPTSLSDSKQSDAILGDSALDTTSQPEKATRPSTARQQMMANEPEISNDGAQAIFFEVAVDPCSDNPFPPSDPRNEAWQRATRHAEQGLSEITALIPQAFRIHVEKERNRIKDELFRYGRVASPISLAPVLVPFYRFTFDSWAWRNIAGIAGDQDLPVYDRWLMTYAESWIKLLEARSWPDEVKKTLIREVADSLQAGIAHWKSEARKHRRSQEENSDRQKSAVPPQADSDFPRFGTCPPSIADDQQVDTLSARDDKVHMLVGERSFRTLRNAEIIKTHGLGRRLRTEFELRTSDAAKSCLDRIRKAKGYPLSRDIAKKRSTPQ